jgi:hypothetical protein
MITISDPAVKDNPTFAAAARLKSHVAPGAWHSADQIEAEA